MKRYNVIDENGKVYAENVKMSEACKTVSKLLSENWQGADLNHNFEIIRAQYKRAVTRPLLLFYSLVWRSVYKSTRCALSVNRQFAQKQTRNFVQNDYCNNPKKMLYYTYKVSNTINT